MSLFVKTLFFVYFCIDIPSVQICTDTTTYSNGTIISKELYPHCFLNKEQGEDDEKRRPRGNILVHCRDHKEQ